MSELKADFKFEIGDMVYLKHSSHNETQFPLKFTIVERHLQQCHGGIQLSYMVYGQSSLIPELVLCLEQPKYQEISQAKLDDLTRLANHRSSLEREAWIKSYRTEKDTKKGDDK